MCLALSLKELPTFNSAGSAKSCWWGKESVRDKSEECCLSALRKGKRGGNVTETLSFR